MLLFTDCDERVNGRYRRVEEAEVVVPVVVASKMELSGGRKGRWKLSGTTVVRLCCVVAASRSWRRRLGWWRELTVELVLLSGRELLQELARRESLRRERACLLCCNGEGRERERERERGCCWGRDMDELALSTLVAGVAVSGVGEDDGLLPVSACIFHLLFFFVISFSFCFANAF